MPDVDRALQIEQGGSLNPKPGRRLLRQATATRASPNWLRPRLLDLDHVGSQRLALPGAASRRVTGECRGGEGQVRGADLLDICTIADACGLPWSGTLIGGGEL